MSGIIGIHKLSPKRSRIRRKSVGKTMPDSGSSRIAPSLLSADFTRLAEDMVRFNESGAEILHLDVMDGHFVPNITFGPKLVKSLRPLAPNAVFDVHLMMTEPLKWIDRFCEAGADAVTVHAECGDDIDECIKAITDKGKIAGISIKPATRVEDIVKYLDRVGLVLVMTVEPGFGGQGMMYDCLEKIPEIRKAAEAAGNSSLLISVDGGINAENCAEVAEKGTNILVAGNAVFGAENMQRAYAELTARISK